MLRSKWSSEEEKNKLEGKRREVQEMMKGGRNLPRGNWPLFFWERHADLLSLHLFNRFWLRPDTTLSASTCARGKSLVQRGSIYYFIIRDSW
jgi:hypothetical protein